MSSHQNRFGLSRVANVKIVPVQGRIDFEALSAVWLVISMMELI